jgi:hypothetical protein
MIVSAEEAPVPAEQFLLQVMAQQAGMALANARLHAQERATAEELAKVNSTLGSTVQALRRSMEIHERLTRTATSGEGQEGIARAVHELTVHTVAVEDRYGNLRAWAGPLRPDPYPKDTAARREELLRRALASEHPIRDGGRLVMVAQPRGDVLGVMVLIDPEATASEHDLVALEHGATVLAMELARLRSLAETELRGATWSRTCWPARTRRGLWPGRRRSSTTWSACIVSSWSRAKVWETAAPSSCSAPFGEARGPRAPAPCSSPGSGRWCSWPTRTSTGTSSGERSCTS